MISSIIQSIATFLFPLRCISCNRSGSALCNNCLAKVACNPISIQHIHSLYSYKDSLVRKIVRALKYKRNPNALLILIQKSQPILEALLLKYPYKQKVFIPIPKHRSKEKIQGYNQSVLIAQTLSCVFTIPSIQILKKVRYTPAQVVTKNKRERLKNVAYSMQATEPLQKDTLYIIVDDVYTTGATIIEAKRALKENGANEICAVTLAHSKY